MNLSVKFTLWCEFVREFDFKFSINFAREREFSLIFSAKFTLWAEFKGSKFDKFILNALALNQKRESSVYAVS